MKIVDLQATSVNVPFEAPLRWSLGVGTGTTRGIIEVTAEDGIIGLGETYGGNAVEHAIGPDDPGLGVVLDRDKLDRYHRRYPTEGAVNEFYDPKRPDWVPALPLF